MYKGKKILAIVPARGGSKGIPNKNILPIIEKPLLHYTLEEAMKTDFIDRLIVSTDDLAIKKCAEDFGIEVPFLRPEELAQDTSPTIDTVLHTIDKLKAAGEEYDYMLLLQNTSPLRKVWHIEEAIKLLLDNPEERSLVSVSLINEHPILTRTIDEKHKLTSLLSTNSTVRRQDMPAYYHVNGAIYLQKIDDKLNKQTSLNDGSLGYIMEHKYSIDIDEYLDLEMMKYYLEQEAKIFEEYCDE